MFEIGHSLGILTFLRLLIQILAAFWQPTEACKHGFHINARACMGFLSESMELRERKVRERQKDPTFHFIVAWVPA